jgi:hypothetical protein
MRLRRRRDAVPHLQSVKLEQAASAAERLRAGSSMTWSRAFDDPVPLPNGHTLVTLEQAARYIQKLPKAEQESAEWQAATEALIMAAEGRGPIMHARIGMLRAIRRNVVQVFTDRKDANWDRKRTLKRDE